MACGECECTDADYSCPCCCASVTGLRGGIHPDHIKSIWVDLLLNDESTQTFHTDSLISEPLHIVSVTASLACVNRTKDVTSEGDLKKQIELPSTEVSALGAPVMFSLFTIGQWHSSDQKAMGGWNAHEDTMDGRTHCATGSLSPYSPSWTSPPDLFGYFCDGGLMVEFNAPSEDYGIRIVLNYVDRLAFSPAYGDPVKVLQHYWKCSHEEQFLQGFYAGVRLKTGSEGTSTAFTDPLGGTDSGGSLFNPFWSSGPTPTLPFYEE